MRIYEGQLAVLAARRQAQAIRAHDGPGAEPSARLRDACWSSAGCGRPCCIRCGTSPASRSARRPRCWGRTRGDGLHRRGRGSDRRALRARSRTQLGADEAPLKAKIDKFRAEELEHRDTGLAHGARAGARLSAADRRDQGRVAARDLAGGADLVDRLPWDRSPEPEPRYASSATLSSRRKSPAFLELSRHWPALRARYGWAQRPARITPLIRGIGT